MQPHLVRVATLLGIKSSQDRHTPSLSLSPSFACATMIHFSLFACLCGVATAILQSQNDTFNSSYALTSSQRTAANLSDAVAAQAEVALNFERSNNAGSLTQDDSFYTVPEGVDVKKLAPGTVLKVEQFTNTTQYTIPMSLSMSRFLYVSELLNGSSAPASAYVLWPFVPRQFANLTSVSGSSNSSVFPVVGLAHGSFGQTQACAPSNIRNLVDEFHEPFPLALAGYAVVAPDYVGTGVPNTTTPYFILPSQANDLIHAVAAAQSAWSDRLSKEFVLVGQSQGGGTTWAATQRLAQKPVEGYLGTVAASPFLHVLADIQADPVVEDNVRVVAIAQGLDSVLPSFHLSDWLTDIGIARLRLLQSVYGCALTAGTLFADGNLILKDGWNTTSAANWYRNVTNNGGKPIAGPMLVIQGTADPNANEPVTTAGVESTCELYPESQLQYWRYEGITHVPVLYSGQHQFLDWIQQRFAGVKLPDGCSNETFSAARGNINNTNLNQNWFIEYDVYGI